MELEASTGLESELRLGVAGAFITARELVGEAGAGAEVTEHVEATATHQVEAVGLGGVDRERECRKGNAGCDGRVRIEESCVRNAYQTRQGPFGAQTQHAAGLVPADRHRQ